jgi:hypothetical protein
MAKAKDVTVILVFRHPSRRYTMFQFRQKGVSL